MLDEKRAIQILRRAGLSLSSAKVAVVLAKDMPKPTARPTTEELLRQADRLLARRGC